MPQKATVEKARRKLRAGRKPSTAAGEFVREEIHHVREGKHGARSPKQAIAIGLSKARRAGVPLAPPARGKASRKTRSTAKRAYAAGQAGGTRTQSKTRARATKRALKREPRSTTSHRALSTQAKRASARRTHADRSAAARRGAATKGRPQRRAAATKAARTRKRRRS